MKVIILTLFLVFISTSLALRSKSLNYMRQVPIHSLQLDKISSLGAALKGLIQLAEISELDEVVDILTTIRDDFQGIHQRTSATLDAERATYEASRSDLETTIASLETSISTAETDLAESEANRDRLQAAIAANIQAINEAETATTTEQARRAAADEAYRTEVANIASALIALGEARGILEQIQGQDLETVGFSFIQTHKKKLVRSLSLIQEKVSKLKTKITPIGFYVNQLVQIAQDVEAGADAGVNADLFARIYAIIGEFEVALRTESDETIAANAEDLRRSTEILGLLADTIATQQASLALNQEHLATTQERIRALQEALVGLRASLEQARDSLASLIAAWKEREATLQGYINRLAGDLDVLERALVFVRSHNSEDFANGVTAEGEGQGAVGVTA